jgi:hypothetical protein
VKLKRRVNSDGSPNGWCHYCPGCKSLHCITVEGPGWRPDSGPRWTFDGNVDSPTFGPSMHVFVTDYNHDASKWIIKRKDKNKRGAERFDTREQAQAACPSELWEPVFDYVSKHDRTVCHYHLQKGVLRYCADSPHALRSQNVPLPDLPEHYL